MKENSGASAVQQSRKSTTARRGAVKAPRSVTASDESGVSLSADERRALIAEAAYLRAESRGFAPGSEVDDWLQAEAEVDQHLLQH